MQEEDDNSSPITDKQTANQLRRHLRFDSMSSINNDNERKKVLQDICIESTSWVKDMSQIDMVV